MSFQLITEASLKGLGIVFAAATTYFFYNFVQEQGFNRMISDLAPFTLIILSLLMLSNCVCLSSNRIKLSPVICSFILSVAMLVFSIILQQFYFIFFSEHSNCYSILKSSKFLANFIDFNYQSVYDRSYKTLCNEQCGCRIENETLAYQIKDMNKLLNFTENFVLKDKGAINMQECPEFKKWDPHAIEYAESISEIELKFNCSGFCLPYDRFLFTDINRGQPEQSCFSVWRNGMNIKIYHYYIIVSILMMFFLVSLLCLSLRICVIFNIKKETNKLKEKYRVQIEKQKLSKAQQSNQQISQENEITQSDEKNIQQKKND